MSVFDGEAGRPGDFPQQCRMTYFKLYFVYDVLNLHCFQGRLDRVPLMLNLDRAEGEVLATANLFTTPWRNKPFCFIEIRLFPCAELSSGCLLGVLLHEMNHIWDFQHGRPGRHDRKFYDRMLRAGYDDKSMTYQEDSPFARAIAAVFRQKLRLKDGLQGLCAFAGGKPDWNEIDIYRAYLDRVLELRRKYTAVDRAGAAS